MGFSKLKMITAFSDHSLKHYIEAVVQELENESFQRVASIDKGEEILKQIDINKPEIIIIGAMLKDMGGIEAVEFIKKAEPDSKILFISKYNSKLLEIKSYFLGASGYISTTQSQGDVVKIIKGIINGKKHFDFENDEVRNYIKGKDFITGTETRFVNSTLTTQQLRIFRMLGEGIPNKEITDILFISTRTLEKHIFEIKRKLGLKHTREVICRANLYNICSKNKVV